MHTRRPFLGLTFLAAIAICAAMIAVSGMQAQETNGGKPMARGPYREVNDAASRLDANDEQSIRAVADAVFNFPHSFSPMPAAMQTAIKVRLVQAEKEYLQKRRPGVQEQSVVNAINALAEKFAAPEYAKTSALQVRYVRMSQALGAPQFMGRGMDQPGAKLGDSVNTEMSPLQALHLMAVVIDQKFVNPDFQAAPAEWDQGYLPLAANLQRMQEGEASGGPATATARARVNPKRQELTDTIWKGLSPLSENDGLAIVNQMFTTLGIVEEAGNDK